MGRMPPNPYQSPQWEPVGPPSAWRAWLKDKALLLLAAVGVVIVGATLALIFSFVIIAAIVAAVRQFTTLGALLAVAAGVACGVGIIAYRSRRNRRTRHDRP
jgi:hypothetical protein